LAFGYKPPDLIHVFARDVLDWKRGRSAQLEYEANLLFTVGEIAAGRRDRPIRKEKIRKTYSDQTRKLIEQADKLDKQRGKIK
jgi:predicted dithiol-disulfide oxidoreductase (DUF899 family)